MPFYPIIDPFSIIPHVNNKEKLQDNKNEGNKRKEKNKTNIIP